MWFLSWLFGVTSEPEKPVEEKKWKAKAPQSYTALPDEIQEANHVEWKTNVVLTEIVEKAPEPKKKSPPKPKKPAPPKQDGDLSDQIKAEAYVVGRNPKKPKTPKTSTPKDVKVKK